MDIRERTLDDVTVVDLDGDLTREENAQFKRGVGAIIDAGARKMVINLAGVEHMDSSGLGELISCYTNMRRVSGDVKLLRPNHRLRNLLVITKLITVFETFDSEPAAVSSFTA
jgi:anti-sigma B factor antagonist